MASLIVPRSLHPISRKAIDPDALKVLYRLSRAGHTAYLVGGGVRDLLLSRIPKDFDVSTSARPLDVKRLFKNCRLVGRRFSADAILRGAPYLRIAGIILRKLEVATSTLAKQISVS